ncbi:glycosyltransferase [Chryseolinea sp. T2]|uniref:glycosyltransferase n=1 Tax=Chryseolinea sp. T2 TaxID=3129255 RepID=UPI003076A7EA
MKKLRILHVIKSLGRGGAETLLVETLKQHDKQLFEFHYVYFLPWKNQLVKDLEAEGVRVTCLNANNNIALLARTQKLAGYLRDNKIDLMHAHLPWAGVVARIASKWTKIPLVYSEHNKQERYHLLTRLMNLSTVGLTTKIVAVSEDVAQSIIRHKPSAAKKVITLRNGVNVNHFSRKLVDRTSVKRGLAIPEDDFVIGTVAVFRTQKRLDVWLDIASKLAAAHSNIHFLIVGDGPLKEMLQERINALGLKQRVHLPGLQSDVRPYLAAMDLYLMSSQFEGLPIALLEAMAMECPVVATNAGGIGEVVRNEIDGLLTSVDEPELLFELSKRVLADAALRKRLSVASRDRIVDRFTMREMVAQLEDLYTGLTE